VTARIEGGSRPRRNQGLGFGELQGLSAPRRNRLHNAGRASELFACGGRKRSRRDRPLARNRVSFYHENNILLFALLFGGAIAVRAGLKTDIEYGQAGRRAIAPRRQRSRRSGLFHAVILVHGGWLECGANPAASRKALHEPTMQDPRRARASRGSRSSTGWRRSINTRRTSRTSRPPRWVRRHEAGEYHLDPARIVLSGRIRLAGNWGAGRSAHDGRHGWRRA